MVEMDFEVSKFKSPRPQAVRLLRMLVNGMCAELFGSSHLHGCNFRRLEVVRLREQICA
jgi:hypothetical protein